MPSSPLPQLVLASTSPYRRALLERLGVPFETTDPAVDESPLPHEAPEALVRRLSEAKARQGGRGRDHALVVGSDQMAMVDGELLGKPGDHDHAVRQLERSSDRMVTFLTGLCVLDTRSGRAATDMVPFRVVFRPLSRAQIESYLARERPYNAAGSFKSEGLGVALFQRMEGDDPTALVGLPLIRLVELLREGGLDVLDVRAPEAS
ncbi:MAG: Maf family nucleotide pyrophosphatase [Gammaproteobacteria bacterium]|nr:Maf family nucleotide pyrophosphatase [Gammaproteobacteria bacterium]